MGSMSSAGEKPDPGVSCTGVVMLHQLAVHSATAEQTDVGSGVVLGLLVAAVVALLIVRYVAHFQLGAPG
jgi:hypothetical protein